MKTELKNDIIASWNESDELIASFNQLTDDEIIKCKRDIIRRIYNINYYLGKHVNESDIIEQI